MVIFTMQLFAVSPFGISDLSGGKIGVTRHESDSDDSLFNVTIRNTKALKEPVLFEPLTQIQLTRAKFKVTTFVDFAPYSQALNHINQYIENFDANFFQMLQENGIYNNNDWISDESDSKRIHPFFHDKSESVVESPTIAPPIIKRVNIAVNGRDTRNDLGEPAIENAHTILTDKAIHTLLNEQYEELQLLKDLFAIIQDEYKTALDHLSKHPPKSASGKNKNIETKRMKRSVLGGIGEIFSSLFGSDDNDGYDEEIISQIETNIATLQAGSNVEQEEIGQNLALINLTRIEVGMNRNAVNALDLNLIKLNHTLVSNLAYLHLTNHKMITIASVQHRLNMVRTGLTHLQFDVKKIFKYLTAIATHTITPTTIPPEDLRKVLQAVKRDIASHPRLAVPYDPETHIWKYYRLISIYPVVLKDYLVILLEFPLVDKTLKLNLYQVHNLPLLHPVLKKVFKYQIESNFIGLTNDLSHVTLMNEADIIKCTINGKSMCKIETALYPIAKSRWCVYALFVNNQDAIDKHCKIDIITQTTSLAVNLNRNSWLISTIQIEKLQVRCLTKTHYIEIIPPYQVIELPNACEGYSPSLLIPAYTEMSSDHYQEPTKRFLGFDKEYVALADFRMIKDAKILELTPVEMEHLSRTMAPINNIPIHEIPKYLDQINNNYPSPVPKWLIVLLTIFITLGSGTLIVGYLFYKRRYRDNNTRSPLLPVIHGYQTPNNKNTASKIPMTVFNPPASTSHNQPRISTLPKAQIKATPAVVQQMLEKAGIDFSKVKQKQFVSNKDEKDTGV